MHAVLNTASISAHARWLLLEIIFGMRQLKPHHASPWSVSQLCISGTTAFTELDAVQAPLDACGVMETMNDSHVKQLLPRCAAGDEVLERFRQLCLDSKVLVTVRVKGGAMLVAPWSASVSCVSTARCSSGSG